MSISRKCEDKLQENLIPMNPDFIDEDKENYLFEPAERSPYILTMAYGKLYDSEGKLFISADLLYVLDGDDCLYGVPKSKRWNHSFLSAGNPVKAAGCIETNDFGYVDIVSSESGHYTPTSLQMIPALHYFYKALSHHNNNIGNVKFYAHDEAPNGIIKVYSLKMFVNRLFIKKSNEENKTILKGMPLRIESCRPHTKKLKKEEDDKFKKCTLYNSEYENELENSSLEDNSNLSLNPSTMFSFKNPECNLEGYVDVITSSNETTDLRVSRYGLAPAKGNSKG